MRMQWVLCVLVVATAAGASEPEVDDYGPYAHFLKSKETSKLRARAMKLVQGLRGLYYRCPTCKGRGEIEVVVQERYYDKRRDRWVPEKKEMRECTKCRGDRMLFKESVARRFISSGLSPNLARHKKARKVRDTWMKRLESCRVGFNKTPKLRYDVDAGYGTVRGPRVALFPLDFQLHRVGRKYEWFVHDPTIDGPVRRGPSLPGSTKVKKVLAADVLQLEGGTIVRVCGVVVPDGDNKIPRERVPRPDEVARDVTKEMVEGKVVTITPDKHSRATLTGHGIAFIGIDRLDLGEELLRKGIVRTHPKHVHMKKTKYGKAQKEAQDAGAGVWAK